MDLGLFWLFCVHVGLFLEDSEGQKMRLVLAHALFYLDNTSQEVYRALLHVCRALLRAYMARFLCTGLFLVYTGLFSVRAGLFFLYHTSQEVYTARLCVCRALLRVYRALFSVYRALLSVCRALLSAQRAVLSVCRAVLSVCRALLSARRALFERHWGAEDAACVGARALSSG